MNKYSVVKLKYQSDHKELIAEAESREEAECIIAEQIIKSEPDYVTHYVIEEC